MSKEEAEKKLFLASSRGDVQRVTRLLQQGVDVNFNTFGDSSLHQAASGGHVGVAELLIKARAQVDSKDEYGNSPLHKAASFGHVGVAKLLIKAGSRVDIRNKKGRTPLYWAALMGHVGVAELLIKAGAQVDSKDEKGETPLHGAASLGQTGVAELLITTGARVDSRNKDCETPKDIAASKDVSRYRTRKDRGRIFEGREKILQLFKTIKVIGLVRSVVGPEGVKLKTASCTVSVPRDAVSMKTEITCQVLNPNDVILPLGDGEMLVSDIIELGPHRIAFNQPATVEMQYSGTSAGEAREAVVWVTKNNGQWRQLDSIQKSNATVAVSVDSFGTFAVVSQLKQDRFSVPIEGHTVTSSTQPAVQITFPKQSVDIPTEIELQVQDVPGKAIEDMKAVHHSTRGLIGTGPVVQVKATGHLTTQFKQPVTVQVPHPKNYMNIQHDGPTKLRVQSEDELDNWVDVTETANIRVTQRLVEFDVYRCSRWIVILVEDDYGLPEEIGPIPLQLCKWLQQRDVQFIVMQSEMNPNALLVECTKASEAEDRRVRLLKQDYTGPQPSDIVRLFEGQKVQVTLEGNLSFAPFKSASIADQHITFHSQRLNRLQVLVKSENGQHGLEGKGYVVFYELPCVVVEESKRSEMPEAFQSRKPDGDVQPPQQLCQLPIRVPYTQPQIAQQCSEQVRVRTATEAEPPTPWNPCAWMSICCHICKTGTMAAPYQALENNPRGFSPPQLHI
ncbi:p53-induced death domain-containing protein 1-like [Branchiostoma floridae]|uniref:P53-induced death domain-containing protein 1-like n=1 Tax=Branchiostoma floridae TaxID=7739 RepID=A0A9J7N1C6_BRAFL|nr:p53-induced death domain-containing protein 1-like [Branchiostoma floridae]